jgi:hypothetical protein
MKQKKRGSPASHGSDPTSDSVLKTYTSSQSEDNASDQSVQDAIANGYFIVSGIFRLDDEQYLQLCRAPVPHRVLPIRCPRCQIRIQQLRWSGDGVNLRRDLLYCQCLSILQPESKDPTRQLWESFQRVLTGGRGYWAMLRRKEDFYGCN